MTSLDVRVHRLEDRLRLVVDRTQMLADAEAVAKRLLHTAQTFDESAATMPLSKRLAMSPAQHCAWAIRFAPDQADPKAIMALHGRN